MDELFQSNCLQSLRFISNKNSTQAVHKHFVLKTVQINLPNKKNNTIEKALT